MSRSNENNSKSDGLSALLGGLLSDPQTLSKIQDVLSRYAGAAENKTSEDVQGETNSAQYADGESENEGSAASGENSAPAFADASSADISASLPLLLSALGADPSNQSKASKEQTALLLAIKPYLSDNRKGLVDAFLQMNKLGSLLKNIH